MLALTIQILPLGCADAAPPWLDGEYLYRYFTWSAESFISNADETKRFPYHTIENGGASFSFGHGDPSAVPTTVEYFEGNTRKCAALDDLVASTGTNAFIVIRNDKILREQYFDGHRRDSVCISRSVAKSFVSVLVGIAIGEGLIKGVRDPITDYLPELKRRGFESITIRDLLTMGSGIRFRWGQMPWDELQVIYGHPDLTSYLLRDLVIDEPAGRYFHYADCDVELMALILKRVTKRSLAEYLQEKIWKPLGMEYPATWSIDSKRDDMELAFVLLNARAVDLAKFGDLYLHMGKWNDKQIVPAQWVAESTTEDIDDRRPWTIFPDFRQYGGYFKYYWWGHPTAAGGYTFWAQGQDGQYIFVSPRNQLVIVRIGSKWGIDPGVWQQIFRHMANHIAPE